LLKEGPKRDLPKRYAHLTDHGYRQDNTFQNFVFFVSFVVQLPHLGKGFLAGLRPYQARPDKGYGLPDCTSMEAMRRHGLSEVLTNDVHFARRASAAGCGSGFSQAAGTIRQAICRSRTPVHCCPPFAAPPRPNGAAQ
jgi:hypothetical protein